MLTDQKERLEKAGELNAPILHAQEQANNEDVIEAAETNVQTIELEMQKIKAQKKEVIEAKLQIPGLTFNGTEFLLNGLPFAENQINTASQIIAGLQIGAQMLDKVRMLRFDGSLIDKGNMQEILAWANKQDIQLFIEVMERDGDGLVIQIEEEITE